nr:universal stress protein [Mycobacterium sp. E796]
MSGRGTHLGLVVGVDGSPSSARAVRWAAREALMRNVGLTVVHVSDPPAVWPAPIPAVIHQRHEEGARKILADAIKVAKDSVGEGNRPEIDGELLCAAPVPTLIDLSKGAHMVVVGCRGQDTFHRAVLGSVSTGKGDGPSRFGASSWITATGQWA